MHGKILDVTVHRAHKLEDVDKMGKNDPYVVIYTDLKDIQGSGAVTKALSNTKTPVWNQTFSLDINDITQTRYLYVEIMDKEIGVDEPIAYGAIPLDQVEHAANHRFDGTFNVLNHDGKPRGFLDLTLILRNRGEPQQHVTFNEDKMRDGNVVNDASQKKHIKSLERKEHLGDLVQVGILAGGLFALHKMRSGDGDKKKIEKEH